MSTPLDKDSEAADSKEKPMMCPNYDGRADKEWK
jgi:hypothetical protein